LLADRRVSFRSQSWAVTCCEPRIAGADLIVVHRACRARRRSGALWAWDPFRLILALTYEAALMTESIELNAEKWEWFKHLARRSPGQRKPPAQIRSTLLQLRLLEEKRDGVLSATSRAETCSSS
jgi:hypothetical protein